MKKCDLRTGMIVEFGKEKRLGLVIGNSINDLTIYDNKSWGGKHLDDFSDTLIDDKPLWCDWTINKVFAEMKDGYGTSLNWMIRNPSLLTEGLLWEREPELRPCPCCGGTNIKIITHNKMFNKYYCHEISGVGFSVICSDESGVNGCDMKSGWARDKAEATKKWNTRVKDTL